MVTGGRRGKALGCGGQVSKRKSKSFQREPAADRRRHLGEAVLRCILKNGSDAADEG
jgi:hypothetical protein